MTIDGYCDHTAGIIADDELHQHYADTINNADTLVYGRKTYQLMENFWPEVVKNPTGDKATDAFALAIDKIPKIVFSHTLKSLNWPTAILATKELHDEITVLKQSAATKDVFIGSPGLIATLTAESLIDEYQLCIHPVVEGSGLILFKNINHRIELKLLKTKIFGSGAIILYYETIKNAIKTKT